MPAIVHALWALVAAVAAATSCVDGDSTGTCTSSSPQGSAFIQKGSISARVAAETEGGAVFTADPAIEKDPCEVAVTMSSSDDQIEDVISAALEKIGKSLDSFDLSHSIYPESDDNSEPTFPLTFNVTLTPRSADELNASSPSLLARISEHQGSDRASENLSLHTDTHISDFGVVGEGVAKKHSKQMKWAAKMIGRLEKTVCKRGSRTKDIEWRPCRTHDFRGWWQRRRHGAHCDGWVDTPTLPPCCRPCGDGNGVMNTCVTCNGWFEGPFACWEPCGDGAGLPHMPDNCGTLYCSKDGGTCAAKGAQIALAFAELIGNLLPSRGATKAAGKVARKSLAKGDSYWKAAKASLKVVLKSKAKELAKKAKGNLRKYMKKEGKQLNEDLVDTILEDGAEGLLAKAESERDADLKAIAMEIVEAVDPTGLVGVVNSFDADGCGEVRLEVMPEDGLDRRDSCGAWHQMDGYYVQEGHGSQNECKATLAQAKDACLASSDCRAIATQSNVCSGQYRVTHGGPNLIFYADWKSYNLRAWEMQGCR